MPIAPQVRVLAALLAGAAVSAAAGAADEAPRKAPSAAESRAILEKACRDDGSGAAQCACLGDFVQKNFSEREIQGAAIVFGDPENARDPSAGITALLDAGFTLGEVTTVAERVVALESEAAAACGVDGKPEARAAE